MRSRKGIVSPENGFSLSFGLVSLMMDEHSSVRYDREEVGSNPTQSTNIGYANAFPNQKKLRITLKEMEIKIENVKAAFNTADESGKKLLLALFPELSSETTQKADNRPVTERIKTFEDAARAMGINDPKAWEDNYSNFEPDILAYFKLRIICAALNEGWKPQFTDNELRYYPWFWLYTQGQIDNMDEDDKKECCLMSLDDYQTEYAGLAYARSVGTPSYSSARIGSHHCLKSDALADYAGKQFMSLWADFYLIRKSK